MESRKEVDEETAGVEVEDLADSTPTRSSQSSSASSGPNKVAVVVEVEEGTSSTGRAGDGETGSVRVKGGGLPSVASVAKEVGTTGESTV